MDVTVSRADLAKALAVSMEFVSTSKTRPILQSICFQTVATDRLAMIATDIETASRYEIGISTNKMPGSVIIPAASVRDFLGSANSETVRISLENGRVALRSGKLRVFFRLPADQVFPTTPLNGDEVIEIGSFEIPAAKLAALFSRTAFVNMKGDGHMAIGEGTVNPNTSCGVRLIANGAITAIAHDGHRIARCVLDISSDAKFETTIPPDAAQWLSKVRWGNDDRVTASRHSAGMIFSSGQLAVYFRVTDIHIPDTRQAFQPEYSYKATFETADFIRAMSAVTHFSDVLKGGRLVQLTFGGTDQVILHTGSDYHDQEAEELLHCQHNADKQVIYFEPRYLLEFAKSSASEAFDFRFNSKVGLCRMIHRGDTEYVYVAGARHA